MPSSSDPLSEALQRAFRAAMLFTGDVRFRFMALHCRRLHRRQRFAGVEGAGRDKRGEDQGGPVHNWVGEGMEDGPEEKPADSRKPHAKPGGLCSRLSTKFFPALIPHLLEKIPHMASPARYPGSSVDPLLLATRKPQAAVRLFLNCCSATIRYFSPAPQCCFS